MSHSCSPDWTDARQAKCLKDHSFKIRKLPPTRGARRRRGDKHKPHHTVPTTKAQISNNTMENATARKKRKEEARQLKRKRIEEAGGVRPRAKDSKPNETHHAVKKPSSSKPRGPSSHYSNNNHRAKSNDAKHRFGRVMERVPCRNEPRHWTLSMAVPGSVVSNCQTRELRTLLVGQIARAAAVYQVDEIVVFDDKLADNTPQQQSRGGYHRGQRHRDRPTREESSDANNDTTQQDNHNTHDRVRSDPHTFMARVLQYLECPQYLRRSFFPMHPDLQFSGLLAPIDAPHHVRVDERSKYREGVVLDKLGSGPDAGSLVNVGIRGRPVEIDRVLTPGIRCTVELNPKVYGTAGRIRGKVVSPSAPREDDGTYWGYTTRLATSINAVFDECPYEGGYDLKIGTSERGDTSVDDSKFSLPAFTHALIVFGGVAGIEESVDADENLKIAGSESKKLFDLWLNICPFQGSRTIRTEEAVLISLARLSPFVSANKSSEASEEEQVVVETSGVEFSDEEPSDESSSSGSDSNE